MDLYLFNLIHQFAGIWNWLDVLAVFLAQYLGYFIILAFIVAGLYWSRYLVVAIEAFLAGIMAGLLSIPKIDFHEVA